MGSTARTVVVIGAGVIGLQAAISLRKTGRNVVLLAKHFPGDRSIEYTSPWAGALWRSHARKDDVEQQRWDTETYQHMLSIIEAEANNSGKGPLSGLALRHSRYFSTSDQPPWFSNLVKEYKTTPTKDLAKDLKHGHTYTSIMINAPMYLEYLQDTAKSLGVKEIHASLPMDDDLAESLSAARDIVQYDMGRSDEKSVDIAAFVNATGISARSFVPDPNVYPIRGHTVTVSGEAKQITTIEAPSNHVSGDGTNTPIMYILPRPHSNTTILGGTKDLDNWDATPSPSTTAKIL